MQDRYREIYEGFRWEVPADFNIGVACCGRWARDALPNLAQVRDRLPLLKHVIGVAGARESRVHPWEALLEKASRHYAAAATLASDPALLIYTSGTTGPPKGALMPQRALLGNLPGFSYSHDVFPQAGDLFWSPVDWAWTGGLMDALLPTLYHGYPCR